MKLRAVVACCCAFILAMPANGQQPQPPASQRPAPPAPAPPTVPLPAPLPAANINDVVQECQRTNSEHESILVVWWIPVEFWILSAKQQGTTEEQAYKQFEAFRDYTVVAVAAGKIGGLGSVTWSGPEQLRVGTVVRDAGGTDYAALPDSEIPGDAQMLISILKPMFTNVMGAMGKNLEMLFFPGFDKKKQRIADPRVHGKFSVVLKNFNNQPERLYEWELPLTSLSEPKFCPSGKEKVQANWKFCPWHGVPLDQAASPTAKPSTKN